jgi:cobalamin biosynthesis protein CobD/CbiB
MLRFVISIGIVLLIHYFLISKFNIHPALHVLISLILLLVILGIISFIPLKK